VIGAALNQERRFRVSSPSLRPCEMFGGWERLLAAIDGAGCCNTLRAMNFRHHCQRSTKDLGRPLEWTG
jgi:hypothetical protein